MKKVLIPIYFVMAYLISSISILANDQDAKVAQIEKNISEAISEMQRTLVKGPSSVDLSDQAKLDLGKDYVFIPKNEATKYLKAMGNSENPHLIGLILPNDGIQDWVVSVKYNPDGYVRNDDAAKWNADDLLKDLTEGTKEGNKDRKERGFVTYQVIGWIEKPTYDGLNHKLVWSIEGKEDDVPEGDTSDVGRFVNYNTYAFGRFGYLELTLMTAKSKVGESKIHAANVLKAIHFNDGKRYEDFKEGMDKVAEYGLAALVVGVAAKKLGLIALAGVFLLKMWKIIAVGVLLVLGFVRRFFRKKSDNNQD